MLIKRNERLEYNSAIVRAKTAFIYQQWFIQATNVKATISGSYLNGIKCYITAIKTYLRFIDVVEVEKNSKNDDKTIERVEYFNDNSKRFKSIVKRWNKV
jgi:hypothetical protein